MTHPLTEWMVIWAGELIMRYVKREKARSAFESMTGHRCKQPAFMFGEMVMFRLELEKTNRMKATGTWHIGTFMGADSRSVEYLIMNSQSYLNNDYQIHQNWLPVKST